MKDMELGVRRSTTGARGMLGSGPCRVRSRTARRRAARSGGAR